MRVVDAPFLESQLAADHLVARRGIAHKLDAAHIELPSLVNVDLKEAKLLVVIPSGVRNGREVDVAELAVGLAQVVETLGNLLAAEDVAIFQREHRSQRRGVRYRLIVLERDLAQTV